MYKIIKVFRTFHGLTKHMMLNVLLLSCLVTVDGFVVTLNEPPSKIRGHVLKSFLGLEYYGFQEIPYAVPPVGKHRFVQSKPYPKWGGILNTTMTNKKCMQKAGGSEDCLVINVYTPVRNSKANLPVLVWVPGGGFEHGGGGYELYNPRRFIDYGIIVVAFNYRVGAFGFLTTEDGVIPGNLGLKDQFLAIRWIHKNIAAFGGDPNKITLAGESAGAISISFHLLSQKSTGLFRAAILQSGSALLHGSYVNHARNYAFQLGRLLDKNFTSDDSKELLDVLRNASAADIVAQCDNVQKIDSDVGILPDLLWAAVVEDKNHENALITEPMHYSFMNGHFDKVPMLMGFNSEESLFFVIDQDSVKQRAAKLDENPANLIHEKWNIPIIDRATVGAKLKKMYTNTSFSDDMEAFASYSSESAFVNPVVRAADLVSKHVPTYLYEFSYRGSANPRTAIPGVDGFAHAEELFYEWININLTEPDLLFSKRVLKMWTNFVKNLNATPAIDLPLGLPSWPQLKSDKLVYLDVNKEVTVKTNPKHYLDVKTIYDQYMVPPYFVY